MVMVLELATPFPRREVMLFFSVMNEANSLFFEDNVDHFVKGHEDKDEQEDHQEYEEEFEESNLMHSINGKQQGEWCSAVWGAAWHAPMARG